MNNVEFHSLIRLEILNMLRTGLVPLTQNVDPPELTPLLLRQGVLTLGCRGVTCKVQDCKGRVAVPRKCFPLLYNSPNTKLEH